jgi:hypothetical protein
MGGITFGDMFMNVMRRTMSLAKKKTEVDAEEVIKLQRQIVSIHKRLKTLKSEPAIAKYQAMLKQAYEVLEELEARQDNKVAEARPDVMRHRGDKTVKVIKRGGKPIGEIGIDAEASEGNGPYYVKLYDGSYDAVGFDTAEEALAELRYAIKSSMSEGSDNLAIGQQMARDGIEYDPAQEGEIISQIGNYLKRSGMTPRQIRGYMIDNDFVSDQLSYLPRKYNKPNVSETTSAGGIATVPGVGGGPKVGSLFGGSYSPKTPFTAKKKSKSSVIKR